MESQRSHDLRRCPNNPRRQHLWSVGRTGRGRSSLFGVLCAERVAHPPRLDAVARGSALQAFLALAHDTTPFPSVLGKAALRADLTRYRGRDWLAREQVRECDVLAEVHAATAEREEELPRPLTMTVEAFEWRPDLVPEFPTRTRGADRCRLAE